MTEPRYQFKYGPDDRPHLTKEQAVGEMEKFMEFTRKCPEGKSELWYLYFQDDQWNVVAGSVVELHDHGEMIQEFKLEEG